jgi:hypothetical protein
MRVGVDDGVLAHRREAKEARNGRTLSEQLGHRASHAGIRRRFRIIRSIIRGGIGRRSCLSWLVNDVQA